MASRFHAVSTAFNKSVYRTADVIQHIKAVWTPDLTAVTVAGVLALALTAAALATNLYTHQGIAEVGNGETIVTTTSVSIWTVEICVTHAPDPVANPKDPVTTLCRDDRYFCTELTARQRVLAAFELAILVVSSVGSLGYAAATVVAPHRYMSPAVQRNAPLVLALVLWVLQLLAFTLVTGTMGSRMCRNEALKDVGYRYGPAPPLLIAAWCLVVPCVVWLGYRRVVVLPREMRDASRGGYSAATAMQTDLPLLRADDIVGWNSPSY
jgi:hypothetical protein